MLASRKRLHRTVDLTAGVRVVPEAGGRPVHGAADLAAGVRGVPEAGRWAVRGTSDLDAGIRIVPEVGRQLSCVAAGPEGVVEVVAGR